MPVVPDYAVVSLLDLAYIHILALKRIHNVFHQLEISIYSSVNKRFVKGVKKQKVFLIIMDSEMIIAMLVLVFKGKASGHTFLE